MESSTQVQRLMAMIKKSKPPANCLDMDLAPSDIESLRALGEAENGLTMGELSTKLGVTKPSVTQAISRLELVGIAERILGTDDRRKVYVQLTEKGRATYNDLVQKLTKFVNYIFTQMGESDTEKLLQLIEKYMKLQQQYISEQVLNKE